MSLVTTLRNNEKRAPINKFTDWIICSSANLCLMPFSEQKSCVVPGGLLGRGLKLTRRNKDHEQ